VDVRTVEQRREDVIRAVSKARDQFIVIWSCATLPMILLFRNSMAGIVGVKCRDACPSRMEWESNDSASHDIGIAGHER